MVFIKILISYEIYKTTDNRSQKGKTGKGR